ncbi:kinase-like domain-containing protein [Peziza echinospora]|nr:kinase-like domain-containing protein [Peziza echinospora]
MDAIRHQLQLAEVPTHTGQRFIPDHNLAEIVTKDVVRVVLNSPSFQRRFYMQNALVECVVEQGRKIMSILLMMQAEDAIIGFYERDKLLDSKLPLGLDVLNAVFKNDASLAQQFFKMQWMFLAPILSKDRWHYDFEDHTILPIIDSMQVTKGGFGIISKSFILTASSRSKSDLNLTLKATVIRKVIRDPKDKQGDDAREEERILHSLRELRHPNIIEILCSFNHETTHNLLFPVADGDLEALLCGSLPRDPHFKHDYAILREMHGLASAIGAMHEFTIAQYNVTMVGCHYDLKPKNILIMGKRFLLADFGLSQLESPVSGGVGTDSPKYRGFYYPPQCLGQGARTDGLDQTHVAREGDAWSFGCILAVVVTFIEHGPPGVEDFQQQREVEIELANGKFTTCTFHANGKLNPAVTDWLGKAPPSRLLDAVEIRRMVQGLLQIDPPSRLRIDILSQQLFIVAHRALFQHLDLGLQQLLAHPNSRQSPQGWARLATEAKRLQIWGQTAGLKDSMLARECIWALGCDGGHHNEMLPQLQQDVSGTFAELEDEVVFLTSSLMRGLQPTYARLRMLNDRLWGYLPTSCSAAMGTVLEGVMLDGSLEPEASTAELDSISQAFHEDGSTAYRTIGRLAQFKGFVRRAASDDTAAVQAQPGSSLDVVVSASYVTGLAEDVCGNHALANYAAPNAVAAPVTKADEASGNAISSWGNPQPTTPGFSGAVQ